MPPVSTSQGVNLNQWTMLDGHNGLSLADLFMGVLQTLQSMGSPTGAPTLGYGGTGYGGTGGGGTGGGCSGSATGSYGPMMPAYQAGGQGGIGSPLAQLFGGQGGSPVGGFPSYSMPGHHSMPGHGSFGSSYTLPSSYLGLSPSYGQAGGTSGLALGYGVGSNRTDLGAPHGPGHSMGSVHSMFDHHDPFTTIGYGRYANLGASWSREGNTVTQAGTIRSHPELVALATRQALEENGDLSGQALYREVAQRLTGYNNGGNGVAGALGLTEEEAEELGQPFNHRLHDISAGGQQWAQRLADEPATAIGMFNNGTLGRVAAVGKGGDTWRIPGGHTLDEGTFQSRPIGRTATGEMLYENTVESRNGANNGHDKHKMIAYSTGGPMEIEVIDNNEEYNLEMIDESIVDHVAAGGSVDALPVFGTPGGHGAGHGPGGQGVGGHGMGGHGGLPTIGYDPFGAGRPTDPAGNLFNWMSHITLPTPPGFGLPQAPVLPPIIGGPGTCPRTGGSTCSCNGNASRSVGSSVFMGHMMH